jgi:nucleoid DNA-binding protein/septal ring-binding cell division protein DamX
MTIDKEQLISLLTEKTGLEREQVEGQLSQLLSKIEDAAEEGKDFEIEGFGTFTMHDGNLQFEPTDTLETEINNKYAGMKPIELIGAFKQPEGDEIPDVDEEEGDAAPEVWAYDDTADEEEPAEDFETEADQEELEQEHEEESRDLDEVIPRPTQESPDDTLEKAIFSFEEGADETDQQEETTLPEEQNQETADKKETDEETDVIGQLLVAAVVVIAIGVGGWLVYDSGMLAGNSSNANNQPTSEQTVKQSNVAAQTTADTQQESSNPSSEAGSSQNSSEPEPPSEVGTKEASSETESQKTYGLRGELNEAVKSGYTIVVHSLTDQNKAEMQRQRLQQNGFRSLINDIEINGTMHYRVGIGQFSTVDAAQQAVSQLPESYQGSQNHFIKRIQ